MKSSKDIPPRVGMQVRFNDDETKRITAVTGCLIICSDGKNHIHPADPTAVDWPSGDFEIEWTPPTDDERRLFMEAARHQREQVDAKTHDCDEMCEALDGAGGLCNFFVRASIAESLALDGADYDNMPDFEELER